MTPPLAPLPGGSVDPAPVRLVLRQVDPGSGSLLRPNLSADDQSPEADLIWDLADGCGSEEEPVAAAATRHIGPMVIVLEIAVADEAPAEALRCLVQQLVAALRRTDAAVISSTIQDPTTRRELLAEGFVRLLDESAAGDGETDATGAGAGRLILQL